MPARTSSSSTTSSNSDKTSLKNQDYFDSLAEFDAYCDTSASQQRADVLAYVPLREREPGHRKLMVCHDYKGGYAESPKSMVYTFNWWQFCNSFIYFSHHRITLPPAGWINAAHRQGVKMFGTLIFEHAAAQPDSLRLLIGSLPQSTTSSIQPSSPPPQSPINTSLPLSLHYADCLANLASTRGFDGFLLNIECPLYSPEHARALIAWVGILRAELKRRVGAHAEVVWYDSVTISGQLAWQDRLNAMNLPFFVKADSLFTNYTWRAEVPTETTEYFHRAQLQRKSLQDIYFGIDVYGRGTHGGGGLGSYRALEHIHSAELSTALFAPGWTWESNDDKWEWERWWSFEKLIWANFDNATVDVPDSPRRQDEPVCIHGPFRSLSQFFSPLPPPDPLYLPLYVAFCPGVGRGWWVEGVQQMDTGAAWTDISQQTSLGDLANGNISMDDAWNGGSCLFISPSSAEETFIPIQSVAVTAGQSYDVQVIYKGVASPSVQMSSSSLPTTSNLQTTKKNGWTLTTQRIIPQHSGTAVIGVRVSQEIKLGQITVYPSPCSASNSLILWASYKPSTRLLSWQPALTLAPLPAAYSHYPTSKQDVVAAWNDDLGVGFVYYNVYCDDVWVGTSVGGECRFSGMNKKGRFKIQGLLCTGEILPPERCAYVDVVL